MKGKIRVLIADDHAMVRMGLASLLGTETDIEVVGEADDGEVAVRKALALKPDVVVMDLMMPKKDGSTATAEIRKLLPDTKILLLTSFGTADGVAHALAAGATGALMKNADFSELVASIRILAAEGRAVSPEIEHFIEEDPPVQKLTQRQMDILASVVRGLTNDDIAREFGLSKAGVKFHLLTIFRKLNVANRTEAVGLASRKHLFQT